MSKDGLGFTAMSLQPGPAKLRISETRSPSWTSRGEDLRFKV